MRLAVFGATGMAGGPVVTEALTRGHTVVAVSRTPGHLPTSEHLETEHLDVSVPDTLGAVLASSAAAILTIRRAAGAEHLLASWTTGFLDAAARTATRVLIIGGAGPLRSPNHPDLFVADDPAYVPAQWQTIARAGLAQLRACQHHPYARWTYLSPPATFELGPRTGHYRRGTTGLLTDAAGVSRITAGTLAVSVLDELESPGHDPHFTVAEA